MTLVTQYQDRWPGDFKRIKSYVLSGLTIKCMIEHVGSTSIPGMVAKPIIDVVIICPQGSIGKIVAELDTIKYKHQGDIGIKGRHAFDYLPPELGFPLHHLYACEKGHFQIRQFLAFRDYLRSHPEDTKDMSNLKLKLDREYNSDRKAYISGKAALVEKITIKALTHEYGA